jgi:hypothetical protein
MNTTTIETSANIGPNIFIQIFNVLGSIFTGIALGIVVVSYMVYPIRSANNNTQTDDEEISDDEERSNDEEISNDEEEQEEPQELVETDFDREQNKRRELIIYNNKLFDELSKMDTRELTLLDLEDLHTKVVEEDTPYGKVIMTYNHTSEAFWWNSPSDNSDSILYKTLDTVARVFAITHDCKKICVNYKEEFLKEKKRVMELLENDAKVRADAAGAGAGASGAMPIKTDDPKYAIIVNNKNRFINKELSDLHKKVVLKPLKNVLDDEMGKMSYADFKKNYKEIINKVKEE